VAGNEEDLRQIQEKLKAIEGKQKLQWISPILVALIGAATVLVQIRFQGHMDARLARYLEEDKTTGALVAAEKVKFYEKAMSLLEEIDNYFEEVCFFPIGKSMLQAKQSLANSLSDYHNLMANAPDGLDEEMKNKMQEYSEYVAERQFEIIFEKKRITQDQKKQYYAQSRDLKENAGAAIKNSIRKPR